MTPAAGRRPGAGLPFGGGTLAAPLHARAETRGLLRAARIGGATGRGQPRRLGRGAEEADREAGRVRVLRPREGGARAGAGAGAGARAALAAALAAAAAAAAGARARAVFGAARAAAPLVTRRACVGSAARSG